MGPIHPVWGHVLVSFESNLQENTNKDQAPKSKHQEP